MSYYQPPQPQQAAVRLVQPHKGNEPPRKSIAGVAAALASWSTSYNPTPYIEQQQKKVAAILSPTVVVNNPPFARRIPVLSKDSARFNAPTQQYGYSYRSGATPAPATVSGYDGTIAINSSGQLVNGHGIAIQLRGANIAVLDSAIYSDEPADQQVWGNTGAGGPPLPTAANAWKFNCARITMNASAFLNVTISDFSSSSTAAAPSWGTSQFDADPNGVLKNGLLTFIQWCRLNKLYMIIDCHSSAPTFTFGGTKYFAGSWGQPLFMDHDCTLPYWTAALGEGPGNTDAAGYTSSGIVAWLQEYAVNPATGTINDIIFELFNEPCLSNVYPTLNFNTENLGAGTSLTAPQVMASGGWVSGFYNGDLGNPTGEINGIPVGIPSSLYGASGQANTTGNSGCFNWWWQAVGYQTVLNGIRALGATNVIQINGLGFASQFSNIPTFFPTDSMTPQQCSIGWHPYPDGNFPTTLDPGVGTAFVLQFPEAFILGAATYTINGTEYTGLGFPVPVIADETGTTGGANVTQPDAYIRSITQWADGGTDTTTGTPFTGTFGLLAWAWPAPGGVTAYGSSSATEWQTVIEGAPFTFTGLISTTVQSGYPAFTGTLNVSSTTGTINPGLVITSGAPLNNAFVGPQISGTPGGAGLYVCSIGMTQGMTTFTGQYWLPINGEGQTFYNWSSTHAP